MLYEVDDGLLAGSIHAGDHLIVQRGLVWLAPVVVAVMPASGEAAIDVRRISAVGDVVLAADRDPSRLGLPVEPDDIIGTVLAWCHIPYRQAEEPE